MYDTSDRLLVTFQRRAQKNEDLIVFGKDKLLDFCHIDDTVAGILHAVEKFEVAKNDVYNLGSGVGTRITDAANLIVETMGSSSHVVTKENRPGEVMAHILDITKASNTLGYEPRVHWTEGVRQTVAWYRSNPHAL